MKRATIEQMDNGYLLTLESEKMEKPQKWVENNLRKICIHLNYFFTDSTEGFRVRKKD
jgi:hypothetical protein